MKSEIWKLMLSLIRFLTIFNQNVEFTSKFTVGSQTSTIAGGQSDQLELSGCFFKIIFDENKPFHYHVSNKEYYAQAVSIEQRITIKNPKFTIEKKNLGFSIKHDNKCELFDMTSTDYFSCHINSENDIIEIIIQWNNRTIFSQNELKLYYNYNNNKKNLLENDFKIEITGYNKIIFPQGSNEKLMINFTVLNIPCSYVEVYYTLKDYRGSYTSYLNRVFPSDDTIENQTIDISNLNFGDCTPVCTFI